MSPPSSKPFTQCRKETYPGTNDHLSAEQSVSSSGEPCKTNVGATACRARGSKTQPITMPRRACLCPPPEHALELPPTRYRQ
jgi:hypothetical protein